MQLERMEAEPQSSVRTIAVVGAGLLLAIMVAAGAIATFAGETQDFLDLLKMIGTLIGSLAVISVIAWAGQIGMRA